MKVRSHDFYTANRFMESGQYKYYEFEGHVPKAVLQAGSFPFNVRIPVQKGWNKAEHRLLVVLNHVDSADLKSKELCSEKSGVALTNLLQHTRSWYKSLTGGNTDFHVAVSNFNYAKTYHLDSEYQDSMQKRAALRMRECIDWLKPTHVLVMGDEAAAYLTGEEYERIVLTRGVVKTIETDEVKAKLVHTIDMSRCYTTDFTQNDDEDGVDDDDGASDNDNSDRKIVAKANLMGFVARNMLSLYFDKLPFNITKIRPNVKVVDNIKRFDKMMDLIEAAEAVGFDTETKNLSVLDNKLLVIQFAIDKDTGYVMPVDHPDAPWTAKERVYVKQRLREFFSQRIKYTPKRTRYLIAHGAKFDLRIIRKALSIPVIHWPVWDTMAGQFCLDENYTALKEFGVPYGNLAQLCAHYGNTFYQDKEGFGKADRHDIENVDFYDETFLEYCAFDAQSVFGIHLQQQKEAETQRMCEEDSYGDQYRLFMLTQMSNIVHDFSHMEQQGANVDLAFLLKMMAPNSVLNQRIRDTRRAFTSLDSVKKCNKMLATAQKQQTNGLFGKVDPWVFDIGTKAHLLCLFFSVLKLKPVAYGKGLDKDGLKVPSLGKIFKTTYKKDYPEVALLEKLTKMEKVRSSYIEAFYKKVSESIDGKLDSHLRPGYGFFDVVTGRSNCFAPSLQQIPQRTDEAKFVKRMFTALRGHLIMKLDYSAHEVRCWSYAGQDFRLGNLFKVGRALRIEYMETDDPSLPARIKLEGDLHRINVARFFKVDLKTMDKDELEKLRDQVKAIVFGSIYGRSVRSIAGAVGMDVDEAQKVYDTFFKEYHVAGKWLDWAKQTGCTYLHTHSFIGRKRNLWGYLTGNEQIMAANDRQAMNSPIQGVAADIAHTAARIFTLEWQKVCEKFGWTDDTTASLPGYIDIMVHDSSRAQTQFQKFLAMIQCANWSYTTGVEDYYREVFGVKLTCPLEVEFEIGCDESRLNKWDWSFKNLQKIIRKSLNQMKGIETFKAEAKKDDDGKIKGEHSYIKLTDVPTKIVTEKGRELTLGNPALNKGEFSHDGYQIVLNSFWDGKELEVTYPSIDPELNVDTAYDAVYTEWADSKIRKLMDKKYPWWDMSEETLPAATATL